MAVRVSNLRHTRSNDPTTLRIMERFGVNRCYAASNSATPAIHCVGSIAYRALILLRCYLHRQQPSLSGKELNMERLSRPILLRTGMVFARSFFPLFAIVIILGAALWGPWISLGVTVVAIAAALRLI